MKTTTKAKVLMTIGKIAVMALLVVSVFLIIGAVLQNPVIKLSINWVKLYFGVVLLFTAYYASGFFNRK